MSANDRLSTTERLSAEDYVRRRLNPNCFDHDYIHLKDLAFFLGGVAPDFFGDVFDYGCGGAPYAPLFSHCRSYVPADLEPGPKVKRVLRNDGTTTESDASYDFVVSTQVLEHVKNPPAYLRECHRILRPGGEMVLTTHGMATEHGCPNDFYRWTPRGLEELFKSGGFEVLKSGKLTTEIRCSIQLLHLFANCLRRPTRPAWHLCLSLMRKFYRVILMPVFNRWADFFPEQRLVPAEAPDSIYLGVFIRAKKPVTA